MTENYISARECDTKHTGLKEWIEKVEVRIERIETKFWWMITLLISNLAGIIALLIKGIK